VFLWFRKGDKGKFVARLNGKIVLIQSGYLPEPGLAEVEVVEEAPRYVLVRILGEAAMLEMPVAAEDSSVRLKTARHLFGNYDVRTLAYKSDEPSVIFYWRGVKQETFDSRLQDAIHQNQVKPPRRRWTN
jgi:hypothetical protein